MQHTSVIDTTEIKIECLLIKWYYEKRKWKKYDKILKENRTKNGISFDVLKLLNLFFVV